LRSRFDEDEVLGRAFALAIERSLSKYGFGLSGLPARIRDQLRKKIITRTARDRESEIENG
jgi:hypothetical protein